MGEPIHGVDGWKLADYRWNEMTGTGRFIYTRGTLLPETKVVHREQKTHYTKDAEPIIFDRSWDAI